MRAVQLLRMLDARRGGWSKRSRTTTSLTTLGARLRSMDEAGTRFVSSGASHPGAAQILLTAPYLSFPVRYQNCSSLSEVDWTKLLSHYAAI